MLDKLFINDETTSLQTDKEAVSQGKGERLSSFLVHIYTNILQARKAGENGVSILKSTSILIRISQELPETCSNSFLLLKIQT